MIVARNFRVEQANGHWEAKCDIKSEGFPEQLVFKVLSDTADVIDLEEPNWAAMALIYQAMALKRELVIEADLSPLLLYNLRNDIQSLLCQYEPSLTRIRIEAGNADPSSSGAKGDGVATGFSAGVDSFCTTMLFGADEVHESLRLNTLTLFDVGAFGPTHASEELFVKSRVACAEYAQRRGWKTYFVGSNLSEIFAPAFDKSQDGFVKTVSLRNVAAAMVLQKTLNTYLPSSSVEWTAVTCGPTDYTGRLEPISLPLFATERLRFQSAGAGLPRIEKTNMIAHNKDAHTRLNVCVAGLDTRKTQDGLNCSRCWKCVQTMLTLEVNGNLDSFHSVFDVPSFRENRREMLLMLAEYEARTGVFSDALDLARANGMEIPALPNKTQDLASRGLQHLRRRRKRLGKRLRRIIGMT